MSKQSISVVWVVGSVIMFLGGFGIALVSVATDTGHWLNGNLGLSAPLLFGMLALAACGVLIQLAAWIGALFNSHELAERTWFNLLLWIGIPGIVLSPFVIGGIAWWVLMLVYVVGAPEGRPASAPVRLTPTT